MDRVYDAEILSIRPDVRGLTYPEACAQAKAILCDLDPFWCTASCERIAAHVAQDCTIFPTSDGWGPLRIALTGTDQCPAPQPGGNNNMLIIGLVGLGVVGAVAAVIASKSTKKVLIARVR